MRQINDECVGRVLVPETATERRLLEAVIRDGSRQAQRELKLSPVPGTTVTVDLQIGSATQATDWLDEAWERGTRWSGGVERGRFRCWLLFEDGSLPFDPGSMLSALDALDIYLFVFETGGQLRVGWEMPANRYARHPQASEFPTAYPCFEAPRELAAAG